MALDRAFPSINFASGIDTKTDSKLVLNGKLEDARNGRFVNAQTITKRNGFDTVGKKTLDVSTSAVTKGALTNPSALGSYKNELVVFDGNTLYSKSDHLDAFVSKGFVNPAVISIDTISSGNENQIDQGYDAKGNLEVFTWTTESSNISYCSIYDRNSQSFILSNLEIAANSGQIKPMFLGGYIFFFYVEITNGLAFKRMNISSLSAVSSETVIDASSDYFDIARVSDDRLVGVSSRDTATVLMFYVNDNASVSTNALSLGGTNETKTISIAHNSGSNSHWVTCVDGDGERLIAFVVDDTLTTLLLSVTELIDDSAGIDTFWFREYQPIITIIDNPSGNSEIAMVLSNSPRQFPLPRIRRVFFNLAGTISADLDWLPFGTVALRPIKYFGKYYVTITPYNLYMTPVGFRKVPGELSYHTILCAQEGDVLTTGLIETTQKDVIATFATNKAVLRASRSLSRAVQIENNLFGGSFFEIVSVSVSPTSFRLVETAQTAAIRFNFDEPSTFFSEQFNNNLLISGASVYSYDSARPVELGFPYQPNIEAIGSTSTNGQLAAGAYQVTLVYEWVDSAGNLFRSAPSIPRTVNLNANQGITVLALPLTIGPKTDSGVSAVRIVPYRTLVNGTIFYRASQSSNSLIENDPSVEFITFNLGQSTGASAIPGTDADVARNEILYTQSGELENFPPPPAAAIAAGKDRAFVASAENRDTVFYSKLSENGIAAEFNPLLLKKIRNDKGDITALTVLDEKLIIFSDRGTSFVAGDGPDNLGLNDNFSDVIDIPTDVGAVDQNGVVVMPDGVMFKSKKGIRLLTRSLQVVDIGAEVDEFNDERILSAVTIEDLDEVRFLTDTGKVLVYNYEFKDERGVGPWLIYDSFFGVDAINWQGQYTYLRSDNKEVYVENPEKRTDAGTVYSMAMETGWIKLQGIQNFQRVRRAYVLGNFKGAHKIRVRIAYDYEDFYRENLEWNASQELEVSVYGENDYGVDTPYGSISEGVYQFDAHLPRQKCQAIKFRFEEVNPSDGFQGFELSNLTLEVGIKQSAIKLRAGKKI